jgi:hypothetical protein
MFDLNISHYNKNELEDLLSLSNTNYTIDDVDKSTEVIKANVLSNNTIEENLRNETVMFLVTVKDTLKGFIESNNFTNFVPNPVIQTQNHFVMSKPIEDVNPVKINNIMKVLNIDSLFRENVDTTDPSKFSINLSNPINKTIGMELSMFEPPSSILNISHKLKNNYFHIKLPGNDILEKITIPDGNYTSIDSIKTALISNGNINDVIINNNNTIQILFSQAVEKVIFNLDYNGLPSSITHKQRLGYLMGFRKAEYEINTNEINGESSASPTESTYFYLSINDFQQNVTSTFVSSVDSQMVPSNSLARLSVNDGSKIVVFNGSENNASPERKYFGPCDIRRIEVQLLDKFGRNVDTNGTDYSFAITFKCNYD